MYAEYGFVSNDLLTDSLTLSLMIRLFISYSHLDKQFIEAFWRHTAPLRDEFGVDMWFDGNIDAGDDFWQRIDEHLKDRDIVCLFISSHYLNSPACKKEMQIAFDLRQSKGISVIPIILSPCAWTDYKLISSKLAIPTDGVAVSTFSNQDEAWLDIYKSLKKVVLSYKLLQELSFDSKFINFLEDASLLTKAHSNKEELRMNDIFVFPELEHLDRENEKRKKLRFDKLVEEFSNGQRIIIVGEDQSGKTTLAKAMMNGLRVKNFIPVYVKDEAELLQGDLEKRVYELFKSQYGIEDTSLYDKGRIVPIVDDFHKARHKDNALERLNVFSQLVLIVDDIFDLDVLQERLTIDFQKYRIKQLKPSFRNELIKKWLNVSERPDSDPEFINNDFEQIDARTRMLDEAMGKVFSAGIMPAYPFFLLTMLSNYDTLNKPLNEEITSQGYCYQALILLFLAREKVSNDKIDTYLNFLTEFAHAIFVNKGPLSKADFDGFFTEYTSEFNLVESRNVLLQKLKSSGILRVTSYGNYSFDYPYLYYFFAGKYYAEHLDSTDEDNAGALEEIERILDNLHKTEYAYITIFLVHHSKDKSLVDKIISRADSLFPDFQPATLNNEELSFFRSDVVSKPLLPPVNTSAVKQRDEALRRRDAIEEEQENGGNEDDEVGTELSRELRRSIKTVEVLGSILRNRAGSLKNMTLSMLFEKGVTVHLRVISSFFELVKQIISEDDYARFIREKILDIKPDLSTEKATEAAQNFFWNMNFGFIVGMIQRISIALGSKTLISISDTVCNEMATPASFIIKHNIAMQSTKNLRIGDLLNAKEVLKAFAPVTYNVLLYLVVQFCRYNRISERDRQELRKLGLNTDRLPLLPLSR